MELSEIETLLKDPDFQYRLKAIAALKDYPPDVAIPILLQHAQDPEFLVRTFVAMGLGKQQTAASFAALLTMIKTDSTPSVRAEAANSLSLFGLDCAPHLVEAALNDQHWIVRRSIMAVFLDLACHAELYTVCVAALNGTDVALQEAAVEALATLSHTEKQTDSLSQLLERVTAPAWPVRMQVARALKHFDEPAAKTALIQLRQDSDHRVAAAALETLLP